MPAATSRSVRRMAGTSGGEPRPHGLCRNHPFSTATRGWKRGGRGWARGARGNRRAEAHRASWVVGGVGAPQQPAPLSRGSGTSTSPPLRMTGKYACKAPGTNAGDAFEPTPTPPQTHPGWWCSSWLHGVEHSPPPRPPHKTYRPTLPPPHPPASMSVPRLQCCCTMYTLPRSCCPPFTSMRLTTSYAYVCRVGRGAAAPSAVGFIVTQCVMHADQQSLPPLLEGPVCQH